MHISYRQGRKEDSYRIAELDYIASGGAAEFLFHDLVPDVTAVQIVAHGLSEDNYPHSCRSAIVAEANDRIIGMALSFPASLHCVDEEMQKYIPQDRLDHFKEFFNSRVEGSYLLDAICVDEAFRRSGIGQALLDQTKERARQEGFQVLSLIVFADNNQAIKFYQRNGFEVVKKVKLQAHELIPHLGGCLLMKAAL